MNSPYSIWENFAVPNANFYFSWLSFVTPLSLMNPHVAMHLERIGSSLLNDLRLSHYSILLSSTRIVGVNGWGRDYRGHSCDIGSVLLLGPHVLYPLPSSPPSSFSPFSYHFGTALPHQFSVSVSRMGLSFSPRKVKWLHLSRFAAVYIQGSLPFRWRSRRSSDKIELPFSSNSSPFSSLIIHPRQTVAIVDGCTTLSTSHSLLRPLFIFFLSLLFSSSCSLHCVRVHASAPFSPYGPRNENGVEKGRGIANDARSQRFIPKTRLQYNYSSLCLSTRLSLTLSTN